MFSRFFSSSRDDSLQAGHARADAPHVPFEKHAALVHSLLEMPAGRMLQVRALHGSAAMRSRLCALGILPGAELERCGAGKRGCVRVRVRGCSIVLGDSMAEAVECRLCCAPAGDGTGAADSRAEQNAGGDGRPGTGRRGMFHAWRHCGREPGLSGK